MNKIAIIYETIVKIYKLLIIIILLYLAFDITILNHCYNI